MRRSASSKSWSKIRKIFATGVTELEVTPHSWTRCESIVNTAFTGRKTQRRLIAEDSWLKYGLLDISTLKGLRWANSLRFVLAGLNTVLTNRAWPKFSTEGQPIFPTGQQIYNERDSSVAHIYTQAIRSRKRGITLLGNVEK